MSYIVDAGVVRWFIRGEEWEDRALRLRNDYVHGKIRLYSPTLLKFECLNVVWKAYKLGLLSLEVLIKIAKLMWRLTPELVQLAQGLAEDFKPSAELGLTCYDASYIAVAMKTGSILITADKTFCEKA